jgi:hypothetical protein
MSCAESLKGPPGGLALVAHGTNPADTAVWLPEDNPGDSFFSNRGRTVYLGHAFRLKTIDGKPLLEGH